MAGIPDQKQVEAVKAWVVLRPEEKITSRGAAGVLQGKTDGLQGAQVYRVPRSAAENPGWKDIETSTAGRGENKTAQ